MKARLKKKLEKKRGAQAEGHPSAQAQLLDCAALLAKECWRIQKLLPEFSANKKALVLNSSVEKMVAALNTIGIEIDDPELREFRDGMTLKVSLFEDTPDLPVGKKVIAETLEPTIYHNNQIVEQARVIVSVGTRNE